MDVTVLVNIKSYNDLVKPCGILEDRLNDVLNENYRYSFRSIMLWKETLNEFSETVSQSIYVLGEEIVLDTQA